MCVTVRGVIETPIYTREARYPRLWALASHFKEAKRADGHAISICDTYYWRFRRQRWRIIPRGPLMCLYTSGSTRFNAQEQPT